MVLETRDGLDGQLIDFGKRVQLPTRDLIVELLDFVAEAAEDGDGGAVERGLEAEPVGLVPERWRRQPVGAGDPVVSRDDGVTFDRIGRGHVRRTPPVAFWTSAE